MAVPHPDGPPPGEVAVLVLAKMAPGALAWGWWRMVRGPGALRHDLHRVGHVLRHVGVEQQDLHRAA